MKKFLKKIICVSLLSVCLFKLEKVQSIVPYYYFPTTKNLKKKVYPLAKALINFYISDNLKKVLTWQN